MSNLESVQKFLKKKVKTAGDIALNYYKKENLETKSKSYEQDYVTKADNAVSDFLVSEINTEFPDHKIISEELPEPINNDSSCEWVMDPIDGTFAFVKEMHMWAVMIAYLEDGETKLSAIYFPVLDEFYFAKRGKGAFLNGSQISVSNTESLDHSVCIFHCSSSQGDIYGKYPQKYRSAVAEMLTSLDIKFMNMGSIASAACYFSKGGVDLMINNSGLDWDYLPVILMAEEAGAQITNSHGEQWSRGEQDVIMSNNNLHSNILEFFKPI